MSDYGEESLLEEVRESQSQEAEEGAEAYTSTRPPDSDMAWVKGGNIMCSEIAATLSLVEG